VDVVTSEAVDVTMAAEVAVDEEEVMMAVTEAAEAFAAETEVVSVAETEVVSVAATEEASEAVIEGGFVAAIEAASVAAEEDLKLPKSLGEFAIACIFLTNMIS
jgi:hypothetical protein